MIIEMHSNGIYFWYDYCDNKVMKISDYIKEDVSEDSEEYFDFVSFAKDYFLENKLELTIKKKGKSKKDASINR